MTYSGAAGANGGFDWGSLAGGIGQINPIGGTVGAGEKPEYDFPSGFDKVPEVVKTWFMRSDNGQTGLNEFLRNAKPEDISAFRAAVNGGLIRPKNQAADQIIKGYGGLRAGDMVGPGGILGPLQDDMPSGMSPEYWGQANQLISTMIDAQMKAADRSGMFNGMPTIQADQIKQQLAQGWKQQFTNEFLANEQKRASMANEGLSQQQINNQNLQAMAKLMGGTMGEDGNFKQTEEGRQFDTSQTGWMNGQRTLAGQAQDWSQQKDVAAAASNPRDYIYAQMLGNARGGLAGQPATNQLEMPNNQPPGGANGQNAWNPANYNMQTGQLGQGAAGQNPLASMQPPGTSGQGTMGQAGAPGSADGLPGGLTDQYSQYFQQAQQLQDANRAGMMGAQQGPGAGAASGLSPGPGSPEMVGSYPGYQGGEKPLPDITGLQGMLAQQKPWNPQQLPQAGQPGAPGNEMMMREGPMMQDMRYRGDGQTPGDGMATTMDMPNLQTQEWRQQMAQGGPQADQLRQQLMQQRMGQQPSGAMQQLGQGQWGGLPNAGQPGAPGSMSLQRFQAPGQPQQQAPGQGAGMPQPQAGVPQKDQFTTSAFSQALLKNRLVPQSGALQNQGAYMTGQQVQKALPNMNKIRAQDYMRGNQSERQGFNAVASQSGFSDEDTQAGIKNNLTQFKAPSAGRMI